MKHSILVIDDEDIVRQSTVKVLQGDLYNVTVCPGGREGLDLLGREKFHLVICDLMMPGMGGMEVLKEIREEYPDLPVVIFTGYATVETTREALKSGAFDYIPKPFTPDELRSVVANALKDRKDDSDEKKLIDLMAVVSHEIQSPLSVVQTTAQTLHDGYLGNLDPKQQKTIEAIIRNCTYLEDIIRNFLDLSKMEMEDFGSFKEKKKLASEIIIPVIQIPEHQQNFRKMPVVTDFPIDPDVMADTYLLQIVVTNYLTNAVKYGKEGTTIEVGLKQQGKEYIFSVKNQGVGIPPDTMSKLFNKYSRLKQKGTEGIKGNGLGLYMCKNIIDKHGGRVWAESEYGTWVTFLFSLPIIEP